MIIRSPTGLFKTVLPTELGSGNIIFTISNNEPPRLSTTTLQLPVASTIRSRESGITNQQRRLGVGELIFTITSGSKVNPGSNKKAFEIGQLLNFTDELIQSVEPLNVPADIVIQHNNNILDLNSIGLSSNQIDELLSKSVDKFNELKILLAKLQSESSDIKVQIAENQKAINEQTKVIEVTKIVLEPTDPINVELENRLITLQSQRNALIEAQAVKNADAEDIYNQLLTVSAVVK